MELNNTTGQKTTEVIEVYSSMEDISQAEEGTVYLQSWRGERNFTPEGEEETIPYYNENCEEHGLFQ